MPHAIDGARQRVAEARFSSRCRCLAGDFFDGVPPGADLYVLKSIIHDWPDERAAEILASCRRAIPPDGRLLVVERIVPPRLGSSADDQALACIDLHMLVRHAGRERTEPELRGLLSDAGFRTTGVKALRGSLSLLETAPADNAGA